VAQSEPLGPAEPGAEAYAFTFGYDWVPVEVAGSGAEAELLCSVLRGACIECLPRSTNSGAGAGDGLGTVGAHDIMVSPQDAQDAREILHEPQ
jgi:hypothetical protein